MIVFPLAGTVISVGIVFVVCVSFPVEAISIFPTSLVLSGIDS